MLKHWQDLELGEAAGSPEENGLNDQQDDDVQDAHTGAADGLHEAESIHSWGMATHSDCYIHVASLGWVKQRASIHAVTAHALSELHCELYMREIREASALVVMAHVLPVLHVCGCHSIHKTQGNP